MTIDHAKAIAVVEVFALREVRNARSLSSVEGERQFRRLTLDMVTKIVEEHLSRGARLGGRYVDGDDDGDGDGPRLHAWLEQRGAIYTLVILRFDHETRTPPVVTDTMAIVHGERSLIGKFVVFREPQTGSIAIEHVPGGRFSDDRQTVEAPRRPTLAAKPVVHRVFAALRSWWQKAGTCFAFEIRRQFAAIRRGTAGPRQIRRIALLDWLGTQHLTRPWLDANVVPLIALYRMRPGQTTEKSDASQTERIEDALANQPMHLATPGTGEPSEMSGAHLGRLHGLIAKPHPRFAHRPSNGTTAMAAAERGGTAPQRGGGSANSI